MTAPAPACSACTLSSTVSRVDSRAGARHDRDAAGGGLGRRGAGAGGGLEVAQLGEVVAGQVQVAVRAERALERRLQPRAAGMRVHVAERPAVHA